VQWEMACDAQLQYLTSCMWFVESKAGQLEVEVKKRGGMSWVIDCGLLRASNFVCTRHRFLFDSCLLPNPIFHKLCSIAVSLPTSAQSTRYFPCCSDRPAKGTASQDIYLDNPQN